MPARKRIIITLMILAVLACAGSALSQMMSMGMMRCDPEVIQTGDSIYLVKQWCGSPANTSVVGSSTEGSYARGRRGGSYQESTVQTTPMVYDCESTDFVYKFTFTGDTLTYTQPIGRGSGSGSCR